jgi:hypothetical protein
VADLPTLVDGLLLKPGVTWRDWFTLGYSDFWSPYPDWWPAAGTTAFARPAFSLMIYLAHFVFGKNWPLYVAINYLAIAGVAAVVFQISRSALRLGVWPSLLAVLLVLQSPPFVKGEALAYLAFASEPAASAFVGLAFLAVVERRDLLCIGFLLLALLTKETAVWAPFAAALTALLRGEDRGQMYRHSLTATMMLSPIALWLGLRYGFYSGLGGTYITSPFTSLADAFVRAAATAARLPYLLVNSVDFTVDFKLPGGQNIWEVVDRILHLVTYVILSIPLALLARQSLLDAHGTFLRRTTERPFLVAIWAGIGICFYLALPFPPYPNQQRYVLAVVMFVWPALLAEFVKHRNRVITSALVVCLLLSLLNAEGRLAAATLQPERSEFRTRQFAAVIGLGAALKHLPPEVQYVYIIDTWETGEINPDYLRAFYATPAEIVRVIGINSECPGSENFVGFHDELADDVVTLDVALPECARFVNLPRPVGVAIKVGELRRSASISYYFPEARVNPDSPIVEIGRRMVVRIKHGGPIRMIIEHAKDDGFAWFDVP